MQTFRGNKTERKVTSETKNIEETIDNKLGVYKQNNMIRMNTMSSIEMVNMVYIS